MILLSSKCERKFKSPMLGSSVDMILSICLANQRAEHVVVTKLPRRVPGFLGVFSRRVRQSEESFRLNCVRVNYQLHQGKKPGSLCSDPGIPIDLEGKAKLA